MPAKITQWHNIVGSVAVELYRHTYEVIDAAADDSQLPEELQKWLNPRVPDGGELVIHFTSSGHSDPGSMYGGPEQLGWPPEEVDERTAYRATLDVDGLRTDVPQELLPEIEGWWREKIDEAELDWPEPPEGERE